MRSSILALVVLLIVSGLTLTVGTAGSVTPLRTVPSRPVLSTSEGVFDLTAFGAVGDGVTDDGPALQSALNAIAQAGGGTLFVPAGRYAIVTPVLKDFSGSATSLTILGVASSTVVNPQGNADELTHGLDLTSEFVIRTGVATTALSLHGLENLLISDMVFIGTPEATTDAAITLGIYSVANASIQHCEFYGLSTLLAGAIVHADHSRLTIDRTVFLGCTGNSGVRVPVVLSTSWIGLSVTDAIFADYGQRPNYYGKLGLAAPISWIMVGNTLAASNLSPRREATIRNVFLDEGGYFGISVIPDYYDEQSVASDLLYISQLRMNVSNLNTYGVYVIRAKRVLIERSKFEWSHLSDGAVSLVNVGEATLDRLECLEGANRIRADGSTGRLTVINSIYTHLDSLAQTTEVITTPTDDQDPVQHVRQKYIAVLGHEPDAAGHDYWSRILLACNGDETCLFTQQLTLLGYLGTGPAPLFAITGQILTADGDPLPGVGITLSGSQAATAQTDAEGNYRFEGLPTSGIYTVTPVRVNYTFNSPTWTTSTPNGDRVANFTAVINIYSIAGRVLSSTGQGLGGATVTLSGSRVDTFTTDTSGNYSFAVPAEGNYTVSVAKAHYTFTSPSASFNNLSGNQTANFSGTQNQHSITGQITGANGSALSGVTVALSGAQVAVATTSSTGTYSFSDLPAGGNYTLTPAKQNYGFSPPNRVFNDLGANQVANFTGALLNYSIAGRVSTSSGQGLSGAMVALSGSQTAASTTDGSGLYSFTVPAEGNYTVSVGKVHYTFTTPSVSFDNLSGNQTVNFTGTLNQHAITGKVATADGIALAGVTVTLSGSQSAVVTTAANGTYSFTVPAGGDYTLVPSRVNCLFTPESTTFTDLDSSEVADFSGTLISKVEFSAASYQIVEGETSLVVTVVRNGDTSNSATATYSTSDLSMFDHCSTPNTEEASSGCDYITSIGTVLFAPGETSKTFFVHIIDDSYAEGSESLDVSLSNLDGVTMGSNGIANVTIADNETVSGANPMQGAAFFVRQHYLDFFNREPDATGLAFWTNQITSCGSDAACIDLKRANVSGAFFLSIEFQETGYLVYRMYKAAYGNLPGAPVPLEFIEFLPDRQQIGNGVVVGNPGFAEVLENNKQAFTADFVARSRFVTAYPTTLTPTEFVTALFTNAGVTPSLADRDATINEFAGAVDTEDTGARERALRRVAENSSLSQQEFNKAFVLMQYFGYMRRNPNQAPEAGLNFDGFNFWLNKLNQFNGNFVNAEMVKAFIVSGEYRQRFGP
ncbi:MAG: carboxypeptidase regulatory-like domain-containing protein [Pyrinomonadaceae bacterium]|nr:carboxypeptidase regulatory-like domain-containing protein [Pyrinomonadaceae bacterium]